MQYRLGFYAVLLGWAQILLKRGTSTREQEKGVRSKYAVLFLKKTTLCFAKHFFQENVFSTRKRGANSGEGLSPIDTAVNEQKL